VLIVVENWPLENAPRFEVIFNDKAFRCLDVFQVHSAKSRSQQFHQLGNLGRIFGVYAQREGIHIGKAFEKQSFAFHDRHGRSRADVAKPQHCRAVGDHAHKVRMVGVHVQHGRVFVDVFAGFRNTR